MNLSKIYMFSKKLNLVFIIVIALNLTHCNVFRAIEKPTRTINLSPLDPNKVQFYWIGHATILIQIYDKWILTDPNFSDYIGGVVKRHILPPIPLYELPELDAVLISHSHFDHLDQPTLRKLKLKGSVFVPTGAGTYIPNSLSEKKKEMEPWQVVEDGSIKITAVPARHFGGRWLIDNLWDGNPYTGYVVEYKDITFYFAGDTGYQEKISKEIGQKFNIDFAFIPVGPSKGPGNPVHVNPNEAVDTFLDLHAKKIIPMHFGTFYRNMESELPGLVKAFEPLKEKAILLMIGDGYEHKK